MTIREQLELREINYLSPYAMLNVHSKGRKKEEPQCDIRPLFQRDRDRILHCKSFRRLRQKTQVFLIARGDHYRTRLTHTLEVSQNARTIAKALRLNEDLVEAIALGHDLGHTPFGHAGERALNKVASKGFRHNEQSIRVVEKIEKNGEGLNLTLEVLDGIKNHQTSGEPSTLEGQIVRLSDKIAYINHDMDDAIRGGVLKEEDIPKDITDCLGDSSRKRLDTMVHDVITSSMEQNKIIMSPSIYQATMDLRSYMFERVYLNHAAKAQEEKAVALIEQLFYYYLKNPKSLPTQYKEMIEKGEDKEVVVCDFVAGMTDNFAVKKFEESYVPQAWTL
ncbi:MAG TPA: deoxyguanosinetriphosphate triphosphohydrolase [Candidatus Dorea intestinavium]|nr:deoxyguanosinetriphosphate triphosphohydrolase [Candidatus Dorea intestinavium]